MPEDLRQPAQWPDTATKEPSLKAAYARLARARWRNYELFTVEQNVCTAFSKALAESWMGGKKSLRLKIEEWTALIETPIPNTPDVPEEVSLLLGEITYNLRAALDYMTCQLSRLDTNNDERKRRRNQFPIESTLAGFKGRRSTFLSGVSDTHVTMIESLQPFRGCEWTATLAALSNVDKHHDLIAVQHGLTLKATPPRGKKLGKFVVDGFRLVIELNGSKNLIETLDSLVEHATDAVAAFRDDFPVDVARYQRNREKFAASIQRAAELRSKGLKPPPKSKRLR